MNKNWLWASLLIPCMLLADDAAEITAAINEGTQAYENGQLSQAATQFDYAATLIRQQQAGELGNLFPEPLSGWTAKKADSQAGSAAFFGGGINASREYQKDSARLTISITKDSPLLQAVGMLFSNPSMASMNGYKQKRINGHTAMFKLEERSQELQMLINNNILIQLDGRGIDEETLITYAEALDIDAISQQ